ncbi:L-carnitine CoA-transferase [Xylanimonas allomyrinae]|uniref:L-carnitine CoA-transferase n=2 Tax=Xylanimonas allomyrinae TaxID=2509459 RepID=A0A4P6EQ58_9MICO|nr:L-carnitine CoA-transferase [Xylanimonas allomyrinae]
MPGFGSLEGVTVVYSAIEIAAPTAAALMAEWGANVIWIENTRVGDSMRDTAFIKEVERRNQRSVCLNPFKPGGREAFLKLIEKADIFIESSKGPVYKNRGLTDELLWEHNPELVITHVSGYGQYGEDVRVNRAAYDRTVQAYMGYLSQNGTPEQPMAPGPYVADYFTALMVTSSSLAALYRAKRTGTGESIDCAMHETLLRVGAYYMVDYLNAGVEYPRPGPRNQNLCAIGEYECADGWVSIICYGAPQNKYLLETIGLGHLWGTEEYPDGTTALWRDGPQAEAIEKALGDYLRTQKVADVERDFTAQAIAAGEMLEIRDLEAQEHFQLREDFIEWETHEGKTVKGVNIFPKFARRPGTIWRPMPALGQDTADVLTAAGVSPEELEALQEQGIVRLGD